MSSGQKSAISLALTLVVFVAVCALAFTGGFNYLEVKFYAPQKVSRITEMLEKTGKKYDSYIEKYQNVFAEFCLKNSTRTYIERELSEDEVKERGKNEGLLFESLSGLQGLRMISGDGIHLHYSSFPSDILLQDADFISYKNYTDLNETAYEYIATADNGVHADSVEKLIERSALYFDSEGDRLVFSFPYFDKHTAYRGSLLFYVYADDFTSQIINENLIPLGARSFVIAPESSGANIQNPSNAGLVFNMPSFDKKTFISSIEGLWAMGQNKGVSQLLSIRDEVLDDTFLLVSAKTSKYCMTGWVCLASSFVLSQMERFLMLFCLFISLFLLIFMLFNIKHDDMVVISERIRKFELRLFRQYLDRKNSTDWKALEKEISLRRQDINAEVIKSLGFRGRRHRKEVNLLLDQSWGELMSAMSGGRKMAAIIQSYQDDEKEETKEIPAAKAVEEVKALDAIPEAEMAKVEEVEELEEIPEEEAEEAEEVEELEEIPEAEEVEDVEELEEIPEAEEVEDVEELEEIPEAEEVEDVEELEEIPEAEDVEDVEELEEIPEAEEIPEVEPVEISEEEAIKYFNDGPEPSSAPTPSLSEESKKKLSDFETVDYNPLESEGTEA